MLFSVIVYTFRTFEQDVTRFVSICSAAASDVMVVNLALMLFVIAVGCFTVEL